MEGKETTWDYDTSAEKSQIYSFYNIPPTKNHPNSPRADWSSNPGKDLKPRARWTNGGTVGGQHSGLHHCILLVLL